MGGIKIYEKEIPYDPTVKQLARLNWEELQKYAYLRMGWTKQTFAALLLKEIERKKGELERFYE